MDELVCPGSSTSCPSPASFFTTAAGHHQELDFVSCDVLEEWLGDGHWLDEPSSDGVTPLTRGDDEGSHSHSPGNGNDLPSGEPAAPAAPKRRGRKPGPRPTGGPALTHVEAERQRRDKLNRRFCELRAAVPTVSRLDRASLLADAASYIAALRDRVKKLEAAETKRASTSAAVVHAVGAQEKLEVRMVGREAAALRLTTAAAHAPARFMAALRSLDLPVQHACVCVVGGMTTVQDAVVDVPAAALRDDRVLRAALLHRLQGSA